MLFVCFVTTFESFAQSVDSLFCNDPLVNPLSPVVTVDYSYVLQEEIPYDVKIALIRKIKHAYVVYGNIYFKDTVFVYGRLRDNVLKQDSIVKVSILVPVNHQKCMSRKIRVGDTYSMNLSRYYPYPLKCGIDYYNNYNFLFGNKVIGLREFGYIHTSNNLNGLYYSANSTEQKFRLEYLEQDTILRRTSLNIISSVFYRDTTSLMSYIDAAALKSSYKKYVENTTMCRSINDSQNSSFLKIKKALNTYNKYSTNEEYFSMIQDNMPNWLDCNPSTLQYEITDYKVMYEKDNLVTTRIIWNSTFNEGGSITYMLIRKNSDGYKLVGLCTYSR